MPPRIRKQFTDKQRMFVQEYLKDLNATQAALRAGYSPRTAPDQGLQLLNKTHIAQEIGRLMKQRQKKMQIASEKVLEEISRVAFGDLRNVASWSEDEFLLKPSNELEDSDAAMINRIKIKKSSRSGRDGSSDEFSVDVQTHDKMKALTLLGQHLNLWRNTDASDETDREAHNEELLDAISKLGS